MTHENKFYSVKEVAQLFDVHEMTIRRWITSGRIEAIKVVRSYRIKESEVRRMLEEGI